MNVCEKSFCALIGKILGRLSSIDLPSINYFIQHNNDDDNKLTFDITRYKQKINNTIHVVQELYHTIHYFIHSNKNWIKNKKKYNYLMSIVKEEAQKIINTLSYMLNCTEVQKSQRHDLFVHVFSNVFSDDDDNKNKKNAENLLDFLKKEFVNEKLI